MNNNYIRRRKYIVTYIVGNIALIIFDIFGFVPSAAKYPLPQKVADFPKKF